MSQQYSDKKTVKVLVDLCVEAGVREVVLSPGSRNAPLIFSFSACPEIKTYAIVDERSAAFIALGMAQQLGRPVALVCTSGTAALNYAPAIAEAYYQQIPLVVITADRPQEWIDQADGQTIRQDKLYANYIKFSCTLPEDIRNDQEKWELNRFISDALFHSMHPVKGPVHINVPLNEPLYGRAVYSSNMSDTVVIERSVPELSLSQKELNELVAQWEGIESVMILVGLQQPNEELNQLLSFFAEKLNVLVLTETTSNLSNPNFIPCIDRVLNSINEDDNSIFAPDLLITFDGQVTSKKIKQLLRADKPQYHWHVSLSPKTPDTYRALTNAVEQEPLKFLQTISTELKPKKRRFLDSWLMQNAAVTHKHDYFIERLPWCDLQLFSILKDFIPEGMMVQVANSTPIRYFQLFDGYKRLRFFANRGTNGIDGSTSTAVGAAMAVEQATLFVTGDLSFFYDSNALWNNYLRPDFKLIVINNGGGGIFRHIAGPMSNDEMESFFEVKQNLSCELMVKGYGLDYYSCDSGISLATILPDFFARNNKASVLEIKTPGAENAKILKEYFNQLR